MDAIQFIQELETFKTDGLFPIVGVGRTSLTDGAPGDAKKMLQVALANEISISEVAAAWMPTAPEIDVKLALARQAGDEASHFQLVADRLAALGFVVAEFEMPANPLFQYLKMAGLVSGLSRQRELHVNLGRGRHPRGRHLADADLVGQRDLQHLLRIAGRAVGQRCPSRADDREEPIGLEGLELLNELNGIH